MRRFFALVLAAFMALGMTACNKDNTPDGGNDTILPVYNDIVKPKNYISIGDEYAFYPSMADGHFLCQITDVRIMTEEECPPKEMLASDVLIGKDEVYRYDEWFTDDGAYTNGCRIILVDVTVKNVDAVAWLASGENQGLFEDPYAFYVYSTVGIADISQLYEDEETGICSYVYTNELAYFSLVGQYDGEDGSHIPGITAYATWLPPGESVSFTVGFPVHANSDGSPKDLSQLALCVSKDANVDTGVFIDMGLEDAS